MGIATPVTLCRRQNGLWLSWPKIAPLFSTTRRVRKYARKRELSCPWASRIKMVAEIWESNSAARRAAAPDTLESQFEPTQKCMARIDALSFNSFVWKRIFFQIDFIVLSAFDIKWKSICFFILTIKQCFYCPLKCSCHLGNELSKENECDMEEIEFLYSVEE